VKFNQFSSHTISCEYSESERSTRGDVAGNGIRTRRSPSIADPFSSYPATMWISAESSSYDAAGHISSGSRIGRLWSQVQGLSAGKIIQYILHGLRPEILQPRKPGNHRPLGRTAWLDGLRGWAALTVCWVHLSVTSHHDLEYCNGYEVSPGVFRHSPAMWPYLRLLFSGGQFSVAIFFTISGYVLTRKPITLLHDGRFSDFIEVCDHSYSC